MRLQHDSTELAPVAVLAMAIVSGLTVANVYFNQALLPTVADSFKLGIQQVGWIATLSQVGYALGILLIVPLGDSTRPHILVRVLLLCVAGALFAASQASSFEFLALFSLLACMGTCVPQVLMPLVAGFTSVERRGRVIATVQTGLVVGILLSRTLAGWIASTWSWRAVYIAAMLAMLISALCVPALLPKANDRSASISYGALLRSLWHIFLREPALRLSCILGATLFAGFSAFWTIIAFKLSQPPYLLDLREIGLFAFWGAAGGLLTPVAGHLCDRLGTRRMSFASLTISALGFALALTLSVHYLALVLAANLISFGLQAGQISNQARVFRLSAEGRSRINTVYMVLNFSGGALGSVIGGAAWATYGWTGICLFGLFCAAIAACALSLMDAFAPLDCR